MTSKKNTLLAKYFGLCPKIKPSEISTRLKFYQYSLKDFRTFLGDTITCIQGQYTRYSYNSH